MIFRKFLNDWEVACVSKLLSLIGNLQGTNLDPNNLIWGHHNNEFYRQVNRTMYYYLEECGSIKVKCTWLVARKACSTHEALQKRGINIASRCLLCKEALETSKHLFLHCKVTTQVWALFTTIVGILWIMPEHTANLLSCWIRRGGSKSQKKWWKTIPACIWWNIGKERN